jgi:hypothetical protein
VLGCRPGPGRYAVGFCRCAWYADRVPVDAGHHADDADSGHDDTADAGEGESGDSAPDSLADRTAYDVGGARNPRAAGQRTARGPLHRDRR